VTECAANQSRGAYSRRDRPQENIMKKLLVVAASLALSACGVETATTAASAAAMKKQEIEQGKKSMEQAQQKINASMQQVQQSSQAADPEK
jgi:hypothetical protein